MPSLRAAFYAVCATLALTMGSPAMAQTTGIFAGSETPQVRTLLEGLSLAQVPRVEARLMSAAEGEASDARVGSREAGLFSVLPAVVRSGKAGFRILNSAPTAARPPRILRATLHHFPQFTSAQSNISPQPLVGSPLTVASKELGEKFEAAPFQFRTSRQAPGQDNSFLIGCGLGLVSYVLFCLCAGPTHARSIETAGRVNGLSGSLHLAGGWSSDRSQRTTRHHSSAAGGARGGASGRRH